MKSLTRTLAVALVLSVLSVAPTGAEAAARQSSTAMSKPALIRSHWYHHKTTGESAASNAVTIGAQHGVFKPGNAHHSMLAR